jgi:hypothetical protein
MPRALLSVQKNVSDARAVIFVERIEPSIPSELHSNTRLLDEAFSTITVEFVCHLFMCYIFLTCFQVERSFQVALTRL